MEKSKPKVESVLGLVFGKDGGVEKVSGVKENDKLPISKDLSMEDRIKRMKNPGKVVKRSPIKENKDLMKKGLRRCKECGEIKGIKWFSKKGKNRWFTICKGCLSINAENRVLFREGLRKCKSCKRVLPLLQFNIKSLEIDGKVYRDTICKDCIIEYKNKNKESRDL